SWPLALSADGLTLTYTFDTCNEDTGIAELLAALQSQGIGYKDLRTSESSLEDIFVSLVHEQKAEA
ncbi:MAG: multidrug ABC transporter ATP-binding protein, partial [Hydrogenophaga sp.]